MDRPSRLISADIAKEAKAYELDSDTTTIGSGDDCCGLRIQRNDDNTVVIRFHSDWINRLMEVSCHLLVLFRYYGCGMISNPITDRQYARSFRNKITIGKLSYDKSKFGGRKRLEPKLAQQLEYELEELYAVDSTNCIDETCRLGDLLIIHKRRFTNIVVQKFKGETLECLNQLPDDAPYKTGNLHLYPLLCIYFRPGSIFIREKVFFDQIQGYARICQVVFAAFLNRCLLDEGYPIEVVAREGFGSSIPSVSDLGKGIRLDPGLLPPKCIDLVLKALSFVDAFMTTLHTSTDKGIAKLVKDLSGFGAAELLYVDNLMCALSKGDLSNKGFGEILAVLKSPDTAKGDLPNRFSRRVGFEFKLQNVPAISSRSGDEQVLSEMTATFEESTGYGSDSDDEFAVGSSKSGFVIKKAAFISGIGGIRIIKYIGVVYVRFLSENRPEELKEAGELIPPSHFASYFELDDLDKDKVNGVSHFNAAPDAKSEMAPRLPSVGEDLVCTIDVTNLTTAEKGGYICRHIEKCTGEKDKLKLLILEESASKYPTGGDLVYGVVRVIGRKEAVKLFYSLLNTHLRQLDKDYTSVLTANEHAVRRLLQKRHLMSRNRDLVWYVNHNFKKS